MSTIEDVARLAGVSGMTVSRVINQKANVSPEKRDAVMRAVATLNYQPNLIARTLAGGSSRTYGLLFTHIKNPIYARYTDALSAALRENGRDIILYMADSVSTLHQGLVTLMSKQADGMLVLPIELQEGADGRAYADAIKLLYAYSDKCGKPFVYLGPFASGANNCVYEDYRRGAYLAVEKLIALGHRDIAYLTGVRAGGYPWAEREAGYREALAAHGIPVREGRALRVNGDKQNAKEAVRAFARAGRLPTAIYCANDQLAVSAVHGLMDEGIRVPEDVSVMGHDDGPYATSCYPPLSTVAISPRDSAAKAVEMLLKIESGALPMCGNRCAMPPRVVLRESVGAPRVG